MYLLHKVIQLRQKASFDEEKPFIEHLEDLRTMILRVAFTLLISMVLCFFFQNKLMEVLRRPVDNVWKLQQAEKMPSFPKEAAYKLDVDKWEKAKAIEHAVQGLTAEQRETFYQTIHDPELIFHSQAVALLRATLALPVEQQNAFLDQSTESSALKDQVKLLLKTAPNPDIDSRGNVTMMSALKPTEAFMLSMKLAFFAGIVVSFPLLLWFILQFILPGLHGNERKVLWPALAIGFGLFLGGVLFAYFAVLPRTLLFFYDWGSQMGVSNDWRIGEYISFATQFTLLFGVAFELPVVVMVLVKLGLLSYETMAKTRNYAIVAIFIAAAVLTPTPDMLTMSLMAGPMIILYEICIWLAYFDMKKNRRREEDEARQEAEREAQLLALAPEVAPVAAPHLSTEGDTPDSGDDGWQEVTPADGDDSDNWPIAPSYPQLPGEKPEDSKNDPPA
ncbi:MAG: twin-arginine translocase subunit TatC [Luteolibacter sp.]